MYIKGKARHDEDKGGRRKLKRTMKETRKQVHLLLLSVLASNQDEVLKADPHLSAEHHC